MIDHPKKNIARPPFTKTTLHNKTISKQFRRCFRRTAPAILFDCTIRILVVITYLHHLHCYMVLYACPNRAMCPTEI